MKHTMLALLLMAAPVYAGTEVVAPPPPPAPSLWNWFAGASAGYLWDGEEMMYSAHFGGELHKGNFSHGFFLEVGYAEGFDETWSTGWQRGTLTVQTEMEVVPLTLNYKLEGEFNPKLKWYVGAGAGVSFISADIDATYFTPVAALNWRQSYTDHDTSFTAQVFAGLVFQVTDCFEIYGGLRYIYIDDPKFNVTGPAWMFNTDLSDYLVELGCRFNF
jgi:opacity protein-like surface antigen